MRRRKAAAARSQPDHLSRSPQRIVTLCDQSVMCGSRCRERPPNLQLLTLGGVAEKQFSRRSQVGGICYTMSRPEIHSNKGSHLPQRIGPRRQNAYRHPECIAVSGRCRSAGFFRTNTARIATPNGGSGPPRLSWWVTQSMPATRTLQFYSGPRRR